MFRASWRLVQAFSTLTTNSLLPTCRATFHIATRHMKLPFNDRTVAAGADFSRLVTFLFSVANSTIFLAVDEDSRVSLRFLNFFRLSLNDVDAVVDNKFCFHQVFPLHSTVESSAIHRYVPL